MDVAPQLEPMTHEDAVIVAFTGLPGVVDKHRLQRDVICVKLRCPGHQGRGISEIQPQLLQAFLIFWELDRENVRWLKDVHFHEPTDDIVQGKVCRTWLLANKPMGHGWESPWDGRSPGLFPKEYLASGKAHVLMPYGVDSMYAAQHGRPWQMDPNAFLQARNPYHEMNQAVSARGMAQADAARRMAYRVPDIFAEQREMGRRAEEHARETAYRESQAAQARWLEANGHLTPYGTQRPRG